ncbi:hypothetical protein N7447_007099 [Penicillium robsamsonii]|uniref:uncharacterized protein n=1 Tax=Penicillium robsamsonii TaxID=1792511 RepID=UPI002547FD8D|nr:uncharacterized protein N7447_007099 [Penicillium robsamsonii]KAJ5824759.1 hypothetical protein N7447_007099 [Penicillium robsamsonii]
MNCMRQAALLVRTEGGSRSLVIDLYTAIAIKREMTDLCVVEKSQEKLTNLRHHYISLLGDFGLDLSWALDPELDLALNFIFTFNLTLVGPLTLNLARPVARDFGLLVAGAMIK